MKTSLIFGGCSVHHTRMESASFKSKQIDNEKYMKCHYIYTEKGEKVLIPGCMAVAISDDIEDCTCRSEDGFVEFERERYNKEVKALRQEIKDLESENAYLNRIIRMLTKHKK